MSGGKSCGGCQHFTKSKNDMKSGGICSYHDARTNTDHACKEWKAIPYNRSRKIDLTEV